MRFIASIQYDGSNFFGFQRLNKERTIQGELEKALSKMNRSYVAIKGAGRTDRGVHANMQVCHFDLEININEIGLKKALNSLLPNDIYVNFIKKVDNEFHARFLVKKKIYTYIINEKEYDAINDKFIYNYCKRIDLKRLRKAAKKFVGRYSYKAFVSGYRDNYDSEIYKILISRKKGKVYISFIGTSFYRYMVRNMVGALIAVNENKMSINDLKTMLSNGEKKYNYFTVPSNGLYLEKIEY